MINIALCSDENYIKYCCTVISSIVSNTQNLEKIKFHILTPGLSSQTKNRIKEWGKTTKINITINTANTDEFKNINTGRFSTSALLRLNIEKYLPPNINKLIYLDSDVIILDDIAKIYMQGLEENTIAAVLDLATDQNHSYSLLNNNNNYFNSGVLIIDMEKWKKLNILKKSLDILNSKKLKYPDQDALNLIFDGQWKRLSLRYNFQPSSYSVLKN